MVSQDLSNKKAKTARDFGKKDQVEVQTMMSVNQSQYNNSPLPKAPFPFKDGNMTQHGRDTTQHELTNSLQQTMRANSFAPIVKDKTAGAEPVWVELEGDEGTDKTGANKFGGIDN